MARDSAATSTESSVAVTTASTAPPPAGPTAKTADHGRSNAIADLYELWTLDIIPQLGPSAAVLFESSPQQFDTVPADVVSALAKFRYRTGYSEDYLSGAQRSALLMPLLGASDGDRVTDSGSAFHQAARGLRQAAVDFVQRSFNSGERQLRNAFRDAARTMHVYLTLARGAVVESARARIRNQFTDTVLVLTATEYTKGLGLPPAPKGQWPRFGAVDATGAALVEELARRSSAIDTSMSLVDESQFAAIQRVASNGAAVLDEILRDSVMTKDMDADTVIDLTYRWWTALRDLRNESP